MLLCPKCGKLLEKGLNTFKCQDGHSYDIAKEGYVNLLLPNKKNSLLPGDNKEMVSAREQFLNKDYYAPLKEEISKYINEHFKKDITLLDAGCGTGYYSIHIKEKYQYVMRILGVDISKFAVQKASKKSKEDTFVVASIFDLPTIDKCFDVILNIFSPKANESFSRVLKDDGVLIQVMPGENHLIELKEILYKDKVYKNEVEYEYSGFNLKDKMEVTYSIKVNKDDLMHLFTMTPYLYKTKIEDIKALDDINDLNITIDFVIAVWGK